MKINAFHWVDDTWGIYKFKQAKVGRVVFCVVFTKDMRALTGPHYSSKLHAKKDINKILKIV